MILPNNMKQIQQALRDLLRRLMLVEDGRIYTVTTVQTSAYSAAYGDLVRCDPTSGGFTVTLPTAVSMAGKSVKVKNTTTSTNTITIDGLGSETIDGSANVTITSSRGVVEVTSDGTNWLVTT